MGFLINRNMTAKLLSLVLALILWVYVMNEQNPPVDASFQIPLATRNVESNLIVLDSPETVTVKVRALRNALGSSAAKEFKAYIDLKALAPGQYTLPITATLSAGYELVEISPDKVQVKLDSLRTRTFTVEPQLINATDSNLIVGKTVVSPAAVTVSGPRSLVDEIEKVLAVFELKGPAGDFTTAARISIIGPDNSELKNLQVNPPQVKVSGAIQPSVVSKMLDVKPITFGDPAEGFLLRKVFTEPARMEVRGSQEILDKLDGVYTVPISLVGVNKDVTREVPLQAKEGVLLPQKTVMIRITVGQSK